MLTSLIPKAVVSAAMALSACAVLASTAAPQLGERWWEAALGNPEGGGQTGRTLRPLPDTFYSYQDGRYQSVFSRLLLDLPVIGAETAVSVREAVISTRPDGRTPITSHLLFMPGAASSEAKTHDGVSAVVVTLLRDDRPKDAASVLRQFEPDSEAVRQQSLQQGVVYSRIPTRMGEAVQRMVRNRSALGPFPYDVRIDPQPSLVSVGISRFVVLSNDSLLEFSQVIPCGAQNEADCQQRAVAVMDRFMGGVHNFFLISNFVKQ